MQKKPSPKARLTGFVLALLLAIVPARGTLAAPAVPAIGAAGPFLAELVADPVTASAPAGESGFGKAASDGRIWADKSVAVKADSSGFEVTLSAMAQEYASTRTAAGSGGGATDSVQADVTFILDMSTSMQGNDVDLNGSNITRLKAMVMATNDAIEIIMEANAKNRVAVYWFGGPVNSEHVGVFLPLDSYSLPSGNEYLTLTAANQVTPNAALNSTGGSTLGNAKTIAGGTPTQNGIIYGIQSSIAKITADKTGGFATLGKRQPFVFLLSDGAASIGNAQWWTAPAAPTNAAQYTNRGGLTGNISTGSETVAAATILSAALQKDLLTAAYRDYNESNGNPDTYPTNFYSVGLGTETAINGDANYAWCGLNPGALLTRYEYLPNKYNEPTGTSAGNTRANIATYVAAAEAVDTEYEAYADNYVYASYYKYASTYPMLGDAFQKLSGDVAEASKTVSLPIEEESSTQVGGGAAIVFTDEIGPGMAPGAPTMSGISGSLSAQSTEDRQIYTFSGKKSTAAIVTENGVATLTWSIDRDDMAGHMVGFKDPADPGKGYDSAAPITLVYSLALSGDISPAGQDLQREYYTNAFTENGAKAAAGFTPTLDNPYYYYTSEHVGKVAGTLGGGIGYTGSADLPRYVQGTKVGTIAGGATLTDLYVTAEMAKQSDGDLSESRIGSVLENYTVPAGAAQPFLDAIADSICDCAPATDAGGAGGYAFVTGVPLENDHLGATAKAENDTDSAAYSFSGALSGGRVTASLGNNGKLTLVAGIQKSAPAAVVSGEEIPYTVTVYNYSGEALADVVWRTPWPISPTPRIPPQLPTPKGSGP